MEAAHDLGANQELRGTIDLALNVDLLKTQTWSLEITTANRTIVRENTRRETVVRISPEQAHYRVGARARFPLGSKHAWSLFVHHQSNHDVDTDDAALNRETISYEIYGAEFLGANYAIGGGLYYDRGTRLSGRKQYWPFDYYLAGGHGRWELSLYGRWYAELNAEVIVHTQSDTQIPNTHLSGEVDVGWRFAGVGGEFRSFLRGARISDYQFLGDRAEHMILFGISIRSLEYQQ